MVRQGWIGLLFPLGVIALLALPTSLGSPSSSGPFRIGVVNGVSLNSTTLYTSKPYNASLRSASLVGPLFANLTTGNVSLGLSTYADKGQAQASASAGFQSTPFDLKAGGIYNFTMKLSLTWNASLHGFHNLSGGVVSTGKAAIHLYVRDYLTTRFRGHNGHVIGSSGGHLLFQFGVGAGTNASFWTNRLVVVQMNGYNLTTGTYAIGIELDARIGSSSSSTGFGGAWAYFDMSTAGNGCHLVSILAS